MTQETRTIRRTVAALIDDGIGIDHGEANMTEIAEAAAHELDHDEWLDDPDHEVWEIVAEIAEARGLLR
jgi:hypothetical protein